VGAWDLERKERKEGKTGENHDTVTIATVLLLAWRMMMTHPTFSLEHQEKSYMMLRRNWIKDYET